MKHKSAQDQQAQEETDKETEIAEQVRNMSLRSIGMSESMVWNNYNRTQPQQYQHQFQYPYQYQPPYYHQQQYQPPTMQHQQQQQQYPPCYPTNASAYQRTMQPPQDNNVSDSARPKHVSTKSEKMSLQFILNPTTGAENHHNVSASASSASASASTSPSPPLSVTGSASATQDTHGAAATPLLTVHPDSTIFAEQEMRRKRSTGKKGHKKHFWTKEEDAKLVDLVKQFGTKKWADISRDGFQGERSGAQLRARYIYCITKQGQASRPFTPDEDLFILNQYARHGGIWTKIALQLQDRNDQDVKNRYLKLRRQTLAASGSGSAARRTSSDESQGQHDQ